MSLARVAAAAAVLLAAAFVASAEDSWVYVGTYTGGPDGSKGIYRARLHDGELTDVQLAAEVESPSFLAVSPNHKFLYAVSESTQLGDKKEGVLHAYRIDAKSGDLTKLNEARTGGSAPCHVALNRTGTFAIVANYGGGSTALFKLKDDGSIESQCDFVQHKGKSVNPDRQEGPHAHCAVFAEGGADAEFAYVADLGLDQVLMFKLDPARGKLAATDPPFVKLPAGSGPRHLAFDSNTGKAYVCGELDSTLITLRHDRQTGLLEPWKGEGAVLSTLPKDVPDDVRKKNSTAEVVVHPSRKTVFVSNRGHDSIATFRVTVEKTEAGPHLTSAGDNTIKTPRSFNVDPTGHWILVASQDGGTVRVIEWSDDQGNGKMTGRKVDVKQPVCVEFVPVQK